MNIENFIGEKKDIIEKFYSETKTEILGFDDYLKLEKTEIYKNNQNRLDRIKREREMGWIVYDDLNKKISSE
jgi:hypothetical protein